jgi:hypothetical protein
MPNWCLNNATLQHDDPAAIDEFLRAYSSRDTMAHYLPSPRDPSDPDKLLGEDEHAPSPEELMRTLADPTANPPQHWYAWHLVRWGTKWDVGGPDSYSNRLSPNKLVVSFDSAWSPPVPFYEHIVSLGFKVKASYWEPGMSFCGRWIDGVEQHYDGGLSNFPEDLIEEFNMREFYEDDKVEDAPSAEAINDVAE